MTTRKTTRKQSKVRLALCTSLTVLLATMAVSFPHLRDGILLTTSIASWQCWAMALAIDGQMISAEYAALACGATRYTRASVALGLALSALFNVVAFTAHAVGYWQIAVGVTLGLAVPFSMWVSTRIGHWLQDQLRTQPRAACAVVRRHRTQRPRLVATR